MEKKKRLPFLQQTVIGGFARNSPHFPSMSLVFIFKYRIFFCVYTCQVQIDIQFHEPPEHVCDTLKKIEENTDWKARKAKKASEEKHIIFIFIFTFLLRLDFFFAPFDCCWILFEFVRFFYCLVNGILN